MPFSVFCRQFLALSLAFWALASTAQTTGEPYRVTIWALVLFGADGRSVETEIMDEADHPSPFVEQVRARLQAAKINPPQDDRGPATFKTGVRMDFVVTPSASGASVRALGLVMAPLPTKTYYASYPADIARTDGWKGSVTAVCTVGVEGNCIDIDVKALPGMPESVRRYAKASLENWTFRPQEINGKPVQGEYELSVNFETVRSAPENFRRSKFERAAREK